MRDPVWATPLRSRYRTRPTLLSVQLTVASKRELLTIGGEADSISESELSILFASPEAWGTLSKIENLEGAHALVTLLATGESRPAIIDLVELDSERKSVRIALSFLTMVAAHRVEGRTSLATADASVSITSQGLNHFADAVHELVALFQAVDSARLVCDDVLSQLDPDHKMVMPPPEIRLLHLGSPLVIQFSGGLPFVALVVALALVYVKVWQGHHRGAVDRQRARALRIENDRKEFRSRLERVGLVAYIRKLVISAMPSGGTKAPSAGEVDERRIRSLLDDQLLPDLDSVFDENLEDFVIQTNITIPLLQDLEPDSGQDINKN